MELKVYFTRCEELMPQSRSELRRTALALRRNGVDTMEELCRLQWQEPTRLSEFRDVGAKSHAIIHEVCLSFQHSEKV